MKVTIFGLDLAKHVCRRRSNIDQVYRLNFDQGR